MSLCVRLSCRRSSASLPQTNNFSDEPPPKHTYPFLHAQNLCLAFAHKGCLSIYNELLVNDVPRVHLEVEDVKQDQSYKALNTQKVTSFWNICGNFRNNMRDCLTSASSLKTQ